MSIEVEEGMENSELDHYFGSGWIIGEPRVVKSGKEATVYWCQAAPSTGHRQFAVKVYREHRSFRNDTVYQDGRVILSSRIRRAVAKKTAMGREAQSALWIGHEYEALKRLHAAGADVPEVLAQGPSSILMEYLGDAGMPAPPLKQVRLERREAYALFDRLLENLQLFMSNNLIHADLSPFNILYWEGRLKVIDFPQAVEPRFNPHAWDLLLRDVENVCRYFQPYGIRADPERLASDLWTQFLYAAI